MGSARVLVLDDDDLLRSIITERLGRSGYEVTAVASIADARARVAAEPPDIALLDVKLPDGTGTELLPDLREADTPVVMMTAHATVQLAVSALKLGARDFLEKPFNLDKLEATLTAALELTRMRREVKALRQQFSASGVIVGSSPAMYEVLHLIEKIAPADATTVLLEGETGTGKGVIARLIHQLSPRAKGPFVNVTCSSLAESLMESELFGHEKGAFTDARTMKRGLVELADGGTLFLDEIGELSLRVQSKLLQFLEDKTFRRVGGTRDLVVNTRIIAATNRNLEQEVAAGNFRSDLYYRLRVVPVCMPPLRDRRSDIEALAKHFVESFNKEFGKRVRSIEPAAMRLLQEYTWPGNVRELRNVLERAVLLTEGNVLQLATLPIEMRSPGTTGALPFTLGPEGIDMEVLERALLDEALRRAEGSRSGAGKLLGLSRHQIRNRLKKFGVEA
ncbi:MAG TPA: sigma-54 dependent transcriptional regulator [Longimicrobiales bacterium]|nr:sigma-54 dependent transcriptional regulator [Longimicrobiales bacterium]